MACCPPLASPTIPPIAFPVCTSLSAVHLHALLSTHNHPHCNNLSVQWLVSSAPREQHIQSPPSLLLCCFQRSTKPPAALPPSPTVLRPPLRTGPAPICPCANMHSSSSPTVATLPPSPGGPTPMHCQNALHHSASWPSSDQQVVIGLSPLKPQNELSGI